MTTMPVCTSYRAQANEMDEPLNVGDNSSKLGRALLAYSGQDRLHLPVDHPVYVSYRVLPDNFELDSLQYLHAHSTLWPPLSFRRQRRWRTDTYADSVSYTFQAQA